MAPDAPDSEEYPEVCREIEIKYSAYIKRLGGTLLELLSEARGLERNHLTEIGCAKGLPIMILTS